MPTASKTADPLAEALSAKRESKRIEFKQEFYPSIPGAWLELLKDIVAMANSGGGTIVVGLDSNGRPTGWDVSELMRVDPADVTNTIAKYVGEQFDGFDIVERNKARKKVAAIRVEPRTGSPLVFDKPGTYSDGKGGQKTAFARGTMYFRHGGKSEPGSAKDVARFVGTEVTRLRNDWLRNVRKITSAPRDSEVIVVTPKAGPAGTVDRFRIVDDPRAPAVARTDYDVTHPYRQTELVTAVNDRAGKRVVGPWEIQCVRRVFNLDRRPEYFHRPKFGSPQYSDALVSWLMTEYQRDSRFFDKAKDSVRASRS